MGIQHMYKTLLIGIVFLVAQMVQAQEIGLRTDKTMMAVPTTGNTTSGSLNFTTPCSDFEVQEGKVWVKLDLGEQYGFGSSAAGIVFDINVNLDLTLETSAASNPTINFDVNLNNQKPEGLVYLDLKQYLDKDNTATGLSYLSESISAVKATINSAVDANGAIDVQQNLGLGLHYEIRYGIAVANNTVALLSNILNVNGKQVTFEWTDSCDAPNYEFQLLRLYNKDPNFITDEQLIKTNVDWSKALSFQTYSSEKQLTLTIGEGQGFYAWRVRPIGTYYENAAGNDANWGTWNLSSYDAGIYEFSVPTGTNEVFFFEDADDNTNYQYSRVFTEGNKISEQATYATTLNQVRQTQRYFPSKDYKIVSQTVLDKSGRPTLTTLPVPIEGEKISRYKNNFVTTNGELYRSKHFDAETNYNQPAVIDATAAFGYYSNMNGDKRIPNAEGYPFTRVIFNNDGTDRVVEQSGVGKTHMIGDQNAGQGRTVRTLYGTPTDEELVALFGDEAPLVENTAKVVTIDPNNTKSVAYITKEGNTIATGLTFSEDEAVLNKISTGPSVSGKTDKITNNTATEKGFKASKRITILEDGTDMNISYTIDQITIEGLCNNLEIDMDYALRIQIHDVETGQVVQTFEEESIRTYLNSPSNEQITIDFGTAQLNTGTYYIQKTLEPANDITAKLVVSQENTKKLIEPYFAWLVDALNEIDCEEEMQALYDDLFFYGKTVANEDLAQNGGLLVFPSRIEYQFNRKESSDPDAPDEFLDFYEKPGNSVNYSFDIWYTNEAGENLKVDYTQASLGDIKPLEVRIATPCCNFNIPIVYTPPFKKPSAEALLAYVNDGTAVNQLNGATNYYSPSANAINPNTYFLTDTDENFVYETNSNGDVTIVNRNAYPLDFEGYAISMLAQCKQESINEITGVKYTEQEAQDEAQNAVYSAMRGWHKPGLLNQMIYHMATDNYGTTGCANRADGSDPDDPITTNNSNTTSTDDYHICDIPDQPVKLVGAQYSVQQLADCWEPLVIELVNRLCVDQFQADIDQSSNVAANVKDQDPAAFDDHFDEGIKSWILRWISRGKIKRKLRKQNAGSTENIKDEVDKLSGNLVKTFLDCTGYAFADIVDPQTPDSQYVEHEGDFDNNRYDKERLLNGGGSGNWAYFSIDPTTDLDAAPDESAETTIVKDIFPNIQDPVYAFKYYAYESGMFPDLEVQNCYRDPNKCYNGTIEVPCCVDDAGNEIPCNFCGVGYITCPYTKESWSCDQRFSFYQMIKNYTETPSSEGIAVTCDNYYEATNYVINPDFGLVYEPVLDENGNLISDNRAEFTLSYIQNDLSNNNIAITLDALSEFPYLSDILVLEHLTNSISEFTPVQLKDINGVTQASGVSIIENDAYAMMDECTSNCENRRDEFREELLIALEARCYEIGECKITTNDNIIPEEDIELMVDQIIAQCQSQCTISTVACEDEGCRSPTKSQFQPGTNLETTNDFNTSYIDFGVSGPVVSGLSNRENETLRIINTTTDTVEDTGEASSAQNISNTGTLNKYTYTSNPSIWDVRRSLTYAEYARWIQATEWDIVLDIPSKCDANGIYDATLTYDANGLPQEPVYVQDEDGNWVAQAFAIAPSPYVSTSNPSGPGDTFVERDQYIKNNSTPISPNDPSLNDPVVSPKVGIEVEIDNN